MRKRFATLAVSLSLGPVGDGGARRRIDADGASGDRFVWFELCGAVGENVL
jgi:hypothetical protein